jgi:transketolase
VEGARKKLDWPYPAFTVPDAVLASWRAVGGKGNALYQQWQKELSASPLRAECERAFAGMLPEGWGEALDALKRSLAAEAPKEATRKSSQTVLEVLTAHVPALIGGSADLTGSNNTKTKALDAISAGNFTGRYIYYGVREHAMAAIMNGVALSGAYIPYGGTFLAFSDYCRPAIRLSALMKQRVIYVMTHDSIGLGEDGPTHQPVEHLSSLRAMPGLRVFRPADATETLECWALALATRDAPSLLALSRQNLPAVRRHYTKENLCALGGYILVDTPSPRVVLIATGSEVHIALTAQTLLAKHSIPARVVSLPCFALFDAQPERYRAEVLPKDCLRVAIEAGCAFGWERYIGENGLFIGMPGFGASAPAEALYAHFGITPEAVVEKVRQAL